MTGISPSGLTVAGVLLAGGQSRRMGGGDKALMTLGGRPMLAWIIERVQPQVAALAINANGDPGRFAGFGLPVVADGVEGFVGPLAGVLAGLDWAAVAYPDVTHVASFACDAPFLPADLVTRLAAAVVGQPADMACAASGGRHHPVVGLWPVHLRHALREALSSEGVRKVDVWTSRYRCIRVDFPDRPIDPFFNVNRPEDLAQAVRLMPSRGAG